MNILKKLSQWFIQPVIGKRIRRRSVYHYDGIELHLPPGVFHPAYFFSTKFLLQYIRSQNIEGKRLLELGAGNGLISFVAAKYGAVVTASDISSMAVQALRDNAAANQLSLTIIESDLFDAISDQPFDLIAINPPYYPETPRNAFEQAWYCGKDFEYFRKLFPQLFSRMHEAKVLMVLSEECHIEQIRSLAREARLNLTVLVKKKIYWEWNYIFEITRA